MILNQKKLTLGEVLKNYTYFKNGDVLIAKITPCMENGKSAIAEELLNGIGFGSTEFHVIRPGKKLLEQVKPEAKGSEVVTHCHRLKLPARDRKLRETDCASTESIFRIVQSIPSKKAEPFKRWLASVGYERVQEIENPELALKRMKRWWIQ